MIAVYKNKKQEQLYNKLKKRIGKTAIMPDTGWTGTITNINIQPAKENYINRSPFTVEYLVMVQSSWGTVLRTVPEEKMVVML